MSTQEKGKHGGTRPGAGRTPKENKKVQMTATVQPLTRDSIKEYCQAKQTRLGLVLDDMVKTGVFEVKRKVINGISYVTGTDTRFFGCEFCDVRILDFEYYKENCLNCRVRPCGIARYLKKED